MKPNAIQITVAVFTGLIALLGTVIFGWCAIWKIYIDVPALLVLSNIAIGALSSLTTLLVGRTVSQLVQGSGGRAYDFRDDGGKGDGGKELDAVVKT